MTKSSRERTLCPTLLLPKPVKALPIALKPVQWLVFIQALVKMPKVQTGTGLTLKPVLTVASVSKFAQYQEQSCQKNDQIYKKLLNLKVLGVRG